MHSVPNLPFVTMTLLRPANALVLVLLALYQPGVVHAVEKHPRQYSIMAWTADQGLPDNFIHDVVQTGNGYLWVATESGLCRFDGVAFTTFDRRSHPLLLSNRISTLMEDRHGKVWFGTHGGGLYALAGDSLSRITHEMGLPSNYVLSLCQDSTGSLWVGTDGKGLGRILPDTILAFSESDGLLDRSVNALWLDAAHVLWIGTGRGINLYSNGVLTRFPGNDLLPSKEIRDLFEKDGTIWIATTAGLVTFRDGIMRPVGLREKPVNVRSVRSDGKGNVWVGTLGRGLFRISSRSVSNFMYENPAAGGDVTVVFSDREENLWAGTERGGLIRLRDEVFTTFTTADGLPENFTATVTGGREGTIWVGTAGGLTSFREELRTYQPQGVGFARFIQTVAVDRAGTVWCGTRSGNLLRLSGNSLRTIPIPRAGHSPVWVVYPDTKGTLWVGTRTGLYALQGGTTVSYLKQDGGLSNDDIRAICEGRDGTLWFGTSYGLNEFTRGEFRQHTWKTGLSNDVVVSLYADDNGDLWVGTLGGLNRLRKGKVASVTMEHGLPDEAIGCILEDDAGFLWIGTGKGIGRIPKEELNRFLDGGETVPNFRVFGLAEGLKSLKVRSAMQPSGWKGRDGRLWFATDEGIAVVDPSRVMPNPNPLPVTIVRTRVDKKLLSQRTALDLNANHDELEIVYTAPTFINPGKVAFRYMLEGLSADWVDAGSRRTAFFSKIPPGEYTFRVVAANEDGIWNTAGASLPVIVRPSFWMTWWFRSAAIILFLSVGPIIYFRRVTLLKRQHALQQGFALKLMASQEAERKRIAAELHDSLGQNIIIMKNRALLARQSDNDRGMVTEQLEEIARVASTTLDDMRKIAYNLRPLHLERFGLTETIAHTTKDVGAASGIALTTELENIDGVLPPEVEMHLFRIVQEALNNVVKHAEATAGSVSLRKDGGMIELVIQDNGRGFRVGASPGKHAAGGFGLEDITQRASLIGARLSIDSSPGGGTRMRVLAPLPEARL